jgi:hypothetical protein
VIRKGEPWGHPADGPAEVVVTGNDAALAATVLERPHARIEFRPAPDSDFARAVGIAGESATPRATVTEVSCDLLRVDTVTGALGAVNMVVVGVAPDRQRWTTRRVRLRVTVDGRTVHDGDATAVVIGNGQFLRGGDVIPRGHPGDGRAEVHVYALARSERRAMRARLPQGEQVPHPRIMTTSGRAILVESPGPPVPIEVDGVALEPATAVRIDVMPEAFSLLL